MIQIWNTLLVYPLTNALVGLDRLTGSLGWAIVIFTVLIKLAMTPVVFQSLRLTKKMQDLAPELKKLKEDFKDNKQGLALAQAELYKKHGANPASGCLPQIIPLLILFALLSVLNTFLLTNPSSLVSTLNTRLYSFNQLPPEYKISTTFYTLNLTKPDLIPVSGLPFNLKGLPGILVILSALVQFLSSKMMLPAVKKQEKLAKKTSDSTDDIMASSQEQMLYMFPLMTLVFGYQFPAGLVIYWFLFSAINMIQQYFAVGWGGLTPWLQRLNLLKSPHHD